MEKRPFRQPWTVEEREDSFVILDADRNELIHIYFNDRARQRQRWLSKDEARRLVGPALPKERQTFANWQYITRLTMDAAKSGETIDLTVPFALARLMRQ
jgi:hypothetical protein